MTTRLSRSAKRQVTRRRKRILGLSVLWLVLSIVLFIGGFTDRGRWQDGVLLVVTAEGIIALALGLFAFLTWCFTE